MEAEISEINQSGTGGKEGSGRVCGALERNLGSRAKVLGLINAESFGSLWERAWVFSLFSGLFLRPRPPSFAPSQNSNLPIFRSHSMSNRGPTDLRKEKAT